VRILKQAGLVCGERNGSFMTKDRKVSMLKDHIETLRDEAKAAEEYITQLEKEK
jgi:hypothetical protein